jgi:hypothetical protein
MRTLGQLPASRPGEFTRAAASLRSSLLADPGEETMDIGGLVVRCYCEVNAIPVGARRALASIGVAALTIVVASVVYLYPDTAAPAKPAAAPTARPRPAPILNSISFGDADHGAVTLFGPMTGTGLSSTWLTSDGSRTWWRLPMTVGPVSLIFDTPRHAVALASGGGSMLTDDGGRSWRPLTPPDPATTFLGPPVFLDADRGGGYRLLVTLSRPSRTR